VLQAGFYESATSCAPPFPDGKNCFFKDGWGQLADSQDSYLIGVAALASCSLLVAKRKFVFLWAFFVYTLV
jgi:hypothetical protein